MRSLPGVFLAIIGLGFLVIVPLMWDASPLACPARVLYGSLCGLGVGACSVSVSHPVTIRINRGRIFSGCRLNVTGRAPASPGPAQEVAGGMRRSLLSLPESLILLDLVGLPSGGAAITGRNPEWGAHSGGIGGRKQPNARRRPTPSDSTTRPKRSRRGGEI